MMRLLSRRGQATTEYILLAAFLVTLLMAISGVLNRYIDQAGKEIETQASKVMSQRELGIPLNWFFASSAGRLPGGGGAGGGSSGGGAGGGGGDRSLGADAGGANTGGGPGGKGDGGSGGDENLSGGPGGTNNFAGRGGSSSGGGTDGGGGGAATAKSGDDDEKSTRANRNQRGSTGGVVEVDDDSSTEMANKKNKDGTVKKDGEDESKGGVAGADAGSRRQYALTNEADRRKGSCEDLDIFRLLKILAIGALIVLGGAYLMSASGNRGGHKK